MEDSLKLFWKTLDECNVITSQFDIIDAKITYNQPRFKKRKINALKRLAASRIEKCLVMKDTYEILNKLGYFTRKSTRSTTALEVAYSKLKNYDFIDSYYMEL